MKLSKLFLFLFLPLSLFSEKLDPYILENFFIEEYTVSNPVCEPKCRELRYEDKFIAKVVDFDASTGITSCEVFPKTSGDNEVVDIIQTICLTFL